MPAAVRSTQREIVSGSSADFFSINNGKLGRIGRCDFGVGEREIVVGDSDERKVGILGSRNHLGKASAPAGSVGMDVNHADSLAPRRRARETGEPREHSIEADQRERNAKADNAAQASTRRSIFLFVSDVGVCSGVMLRWSRSRIGNGYALQRGTQIVASVISGMICVK